MLQRTARSGSPWGPRALGLVVPTLLAALLATTPPRARGSVPELPLPEWLHVELAIVRLPELDRPGEAVATIERRVGQGWSARWTLELPAGLECAGAHSGEAALAASDRVTLSLGLTARQALDGAQIVLAVTAPVPAGALRAEAQRRYAGDAARLKAALTLIDHLPASQTVRAAAGLSVTTREAWRATEGPIARRYLAVPGTKDAAFAVLETLPGQDAAALVRRIASLGARKDRLDSHVTREPALDLARARLQLALERAAAGQKALARAGLSEIAASDLSASPGLGAVRRLLEGAMASLAGDAQGAIATWTALAADQGVSPRVRAYAHYDLGELARTLGSPAREHYARALVENPTLTVARARLERR